jgi:hypothetical protein
VSAAHISGLECVKATDNTFKHCIVLTTGGINKFKPRLISTASVMLTCDHIITVSAMLIADGKRAEAAGLTTRFETRDLGIYDYDPNSFLFFLGSCVGLIGFKSHNFT